MCEENSAGDGSGGAARTLSRRGMLRLSALGGAAALGGGLLRPGMAEAAPRRRDPITTPREALQELMAGNCRFSQAHAQEPHRELRALPNIPEQAPFASVLGCADSRVPVELVFDVFVCRSAGNTAASELIASLEYGAAQLKSKLVMVLGHSDCGAVKAAIAGAPVPGQISTLFPAIQPAVARAGGNLARATELNVLDQVRLLASASTVLAPMVANGSIWIVGAVYDVATGVVRLVSCPGVVPPCSAPPACPPPPA